MTDKEKLSKIRAEIKKQRQLIRPKNTGEMKVVDIPKPLEQGWLNALKWMEGLIDSMQEEPKSKFEQSIQEGDNIVYNEDLGCRVNLSQLKRVAKKEEPSSEGLEEVAHQYYKPNETFMDGFKKGAKWQKENLWKSADGDDLPEYDREVIAILDYDFGHYKVVYAHRPNPNGWNGTNIDTEEKEHFEPVIYDKGGWNQPHILYWLDAKLPYEEKMIKK